MPVVQRPLMPNDTEGMDEEKEEQKKNEDDVPPLEHLPEDLDGQVFETDDERVFQRLNASISTCVRRI